MLIPVNKNIDEFKDDFYKGLTFRQTIFAMITLAVGAGAFLLFSLYFKIPQTISLYLTLLLAFPIAASGFLKIHGMRPLEYFKLRKKVNENNFYTFVPELLWNGYLPEEPKKKEENKQNKKEETIYLETEEEIMKWYEE